MSSIVQFQVSLNDSDLESFLKVIRAFDLTHTDCRFEVTAYGADNMTVDEIKGMLDRVGIPVISAGRKQ